jgi:hypothetical protein
MNLIQKVQGTTDFSLVLLSVVAKIHVNNIIQTRVRQDVREALSTTLLTETGGRSLHILVRYKPEEFRYRDSAADGIKSRVLWRGKDGHNEITIDVFSFSLSIF